MFRAGRDGDGGAVLAQVDRNEARHLARVVAHVLRRAVPELAVEALSPALELAGVEDRARVVTSGRDGDGGAVLAQVDRNEARHLARVVSQVVPRAVPELAGGSQPPAFELASVEDRARVVPASRDGDDGAVDAQVDHTEGLHLARSVALVVRRSVPEPAVLVFPPANELAVVEDRARV